MYRHLPISLIIHMYIFLVGIVIYFLESSVVIFFLGQILTTERLYVIEGKVICAVSASGNSQPDQPHRYLARRTLN